MEGSVGQQEAGRHVGAHHVGPEGCGKDVFLYGFAFCTAQCGRGVDGGLGGGQWGVREAVSIVLMEGMAVVLSDDRAGGENQVNGGYKRELGHKRMDHAEPGES